MYGDFLDMLKPSLKNKANCCGYFWVTFGKIWATFYFSIWSHYQTCREEKMLTFVSVRLRFFASYVSREVCGRFQSQRSQYTHIEIVVYTHRESMLICIYLLAIDEFKPFFVFYVKHQLNKIRDRSKHIEIVLYTHRERMLICIYLLALDEFKPFFVYYVKHQLNKEKLFCKQKSFLPCSKMSQLSINIQFIKRFLTIHSLCVYYDHYGLNHLKVLTALQSDQMAIWFVKFWPFATQKIYAQWHNNWRGWGTGQGRLAFVWEQLEEGCV